MEGSIRKADMLLPFLALSILALLVCMTRYADYDLWWHLRLGEIVLAKLAPASVDTFSYTVAGRAQFSGEWLADAVIYGVYAAGGFLGLNLLKWVLLLLTAAFIYLQIRLESGAARGYALAALLTLLLALFAVRFRLFVRPYIFSLPLLAMTMYLLSRWRSGLSDRGIYLVPIIMLLWVNLSVGAVFGLFFTVAAVGLELIEKRSLRLLPLLLLTLAASLASPEGYRLYTLAFDLTSDPYRTLIGEYQPVTMDILFGSGLRYTLWFQLLAVGTAAYFILCRGWRDTLKLVACAFLLYESCRQIRLVELFSVIAAPCFALLLLRLGTLLPEIPQKLKTPAALLLSAAILSLVPFAVLNSPVYAFGIGQKEGAFPEGAIRFMEEQGVKGKIFNSYAFGGYLIWRAKDRPVFIDGRYRRVYTPAEYGEYKGMLENAEAWQKGEVKYGFDHALIEYDLLSRRFPAHLLTNHQWALVYWDNYSLLFVKRTPEREQLIRAHEYLVARPTFLDLSYLDQYSQKGGLSEALAGLDREVALNPDNQFVLLARVYLRYQLGKLYQQQIRADLERTLAMKPDFAMKHSAYAMILAADGEQERAKKELFAALKQNPLDEAAHALARSMGIKVTIPKGAIAGHP